MDPQEFPGGPRAEDRPSRSAKLFLRVNETLEDTWLADPVRKGYAFGDWDHRKGDFPQIAKPLNYLAPKKKSGRGISESTVPQEIPMIFTDPKVSDLLHSDSGIEFESGKISLNCSEIFIRDFLSALPQEKKLIQIEKVNLQAVGESLAACTVTKTLREKLDNLSQDLGSKHPSQFDWNEEVDNLFDLAQLADTLCNRLKKMSTTNEMLLRLLLRNSVLPRLKGSSGEQDVKKDLLYSDFGGPTLFGQVNSSKAEYYKSGTQNFWKYRLDNKGESTKNKWIDKTGFSTPAGKKTRRAFNPPKPAATVDATSQSFIQAGKPPGKQKGKRGKWNNKRKS